MKTLKIKTIQLLLTSIAFSGLFFNCKKDDEKPETPQTEEESPELLTSMILQFQDSSNANSKIYAEYRDPDGPGGKNFTKFDTIKLNTNKTYLLNIILLNESVTPFDSISKEVWDKRNDHQLFFNHNNLNLNTTYLDFDSNALPLGLNTKWRTGANSNGTSKITLKHQANTKNGTITTGETDIEVLFQTKIN